jgi:hypothetical protein
MVALRAVVPVPPKPVEVGVVEPEHRISGDTEASDIVPPTQMWIEPWIPLIGPVKSA